MKLIKKFDVFIPYEELNDVLSNESSSIVHAMVVDLLREAFKLGREAERLETTESKINEEGGILNLV